MLTAEKTKDFLCFKDQVELLKNRGLVIKNEQHAENVLKTINYYRLSAYTLSLKKDDVFFNGITFEDVMALYSFDEDLRNTILKYTPTIENAFRTHISYHHAQAYGPLGYLCADKFLDPLNHEKFIAILEKEIDKSKEIFIAHHKRNKNCAFPFWVAIEVTTFDVLSKTFQNLINEDKNIISKTYYGVGREYVQNWLHIAVVARNTAAHGGRFYNRYFDKSVKMPDKLKRKIKLNSTFAFIFAIFKLLPSTELKKKMISDILQLFCKYPFVLKRLIGFPEDWDMILINEI